MVLGFGHCVLPFESLGTSSVLTGSVRVQIDPVLPAAVARLSVEASAPVIPIKLMFHVFPNPHAADLGGNGRPITSPNGPLTPASGPTKRMTLPLKATSAAAALFCSFQPPGPVQSPGKNKRG